MHDSDTIAAISTAHGTGGIGIVRISGERAFEIAARLFRGRKRFEDIKSHTVSAGKIADPGTGEVLDEVLLIKMAKPHTFTREDVVEIDCHGGMVVQRRILELIIKEGARLAGPGEFTMRAFLNGRLDLTQAEAVVDLINSKTDEASRAAVNQLEGRLSDRIRDAVKRLVELIAHIEDSVDYPEYDIEEITGRMVYDRLGEIAEDLGKISGGFEKGRIIREGINAVIIGKPNVGKSSLLNELSGKNRAIVTDIPGTTRDIIEEYVNIRGVPVRITDTAGLRETDDAVERIGVEKAEKAIDSADLIIYMLDAREGVSDSDRHIIDRIKSKKLIVLVNKIDLTDSVPELPGFEGIPVIETSLTNGVGMEDLEARIKEMFLKGEIRSNNEVLLTNVRHKELIDRAAESIQEARRAYENGMPLDFITIDIKNAAESLGRITGESVSEDVIREIFSRFCIGK
jgi:tRNA modification GTPase